MHQIFYNKSLSIFSFTLVSNFLNLKDIENAQVQIFT